MSSDFFVSGRVIEIQHTVYPDLYLERALKGAASGRKPSELMPWSEECTGFAIEAKERKEDGGQEKRPA